MLYVQGLFPKVTRGSAGGRGGDTGVHLDVVSDLDYGHPRLKVVKDAVVSFGASWFVTGLTLQTSVTETETETLSGY